MAFITIVDDRRSYWKSVIGPGPEFAGFRQNPVSESSCKYLITTGGEVIFDDVRSDCLSSPKASKTPRPRLPWDVSAPSSGRAGTTAAHMAAPDLITWINTRTAPPPRQDESSRQ
ncbi:hypothetical protein F4553_000027 [Allocatelliglobosispora scoriae]|uniref:Uncharacterized protein n=1 Tax=Allocatelliglobosispora scoriae TaxID=643052 RepID=A0A841BH63_9ACTN|nr:hypothetical protein [Allocatelliglobosispora scoriae]MBB5866648.1 hypothetical protein [Allocatelliglobosispora scoriae]